MIDNANIDLTEHRDFRFDSPTIIRGFTSSNNDAFWKQVQKREQIRMYGNKFKWNVYPIDFIYKYDGLVALGNAAQRKDTVDVYYWGTCDSEVCDCCGNKYKKIPWKKDWGLCEKCDIRPKPVPLWNI